ncbi:MAG TPA: RodZ domain-containing protein [Desulfitobacteriaceae bacterium]|nr:RodZ domain-containing protein [Desulfitobacteriaceae bacterium]
MAGEGEKLRLARENKTWSLTEAEEVTKIRARYLEALESEEYNIIPGMAYVKGFLRTYARHLDLDPEEILALYKSSRISENKPILKVPQYTAHLRPWWRRPTMAVVMALLVIILVVAIAHWSPHSQTAVTYTPAPLPSSPAGNAADSSDQESTAAKSPADSYSDGLIVQLEFNQNCWLLVKADGKVALEGEYSMGTTKEIKASDKIEFVTVGNAGGLVVSINGAVQPSLGDSGEVVNNIVLTKDTINVQ